MLDSHDRLPRKRDVGLRPRSLIGVSQPFVNFWSVQMSKLKRYTPQSEAELHMIIQSDLSAIEEGIELLQHEYPSGKGFIDF